MIRILRILEYTFQTPEQAQENMDHWGVPPNGTKCFGKHDENTIKSAVIVDMDFHD